MVTGLEAIFEAGFREFARLRDKRKLDGRAQLEGAQRAMRATYAREVDRLERNLELLANIGSTAPYVGLVGTVFGIMVTMHDMLNSGEQAGIAAVAPGISEALFATAIGLFVAIPAVWAYNRFTTRVERLSVRYETFAEEFSSILQRQIRRRRISGVRHGRRHLSPSQAPQAQIRDQRRALHRRDAGAADHLHGHRAAAHPERRRHLAQGQRQGGGTARRIRSSWSPIPTAAWD